ncbi:hypothetical protein [Eubacterium sp. F2]|uniref:hypothetical protein n=1 Tax=Eubacterium sp. F2 TaxID=3381348 RepID=UPI003907FA16
MSEFCSLCGNLNGNQTFKGGVICRDCLSVVRSMHLSGDIHLPDLRCRTIPAQYAAEQPRRSSMPYI